MKKPVMIVGVLAVLGVAGYFGFKMFFGSGSVADYELVPRDAAGFVTVHVSEIVKTDLGKKLNDLLQKQIEGEGSEEVEKLRKESGLTLDDIDRVTVVTSGVPPNYWIVVKMKKVVDRKKLLDAMIEKPEEKKEQGKTYYDIVGKYALHFHNDTTLLVTETEFVKDVFSSTAKVDSGPLDEAVKIAAKGKHHIVAGLNGDRAAKAFGGADRRQDDRRLAGRGIRAVGLGAFPVAGAAKAERRDGPRGDEHELPVPNPGKMGAKTGWIALTVKDTIALESSIAFESSDKAKAGADEANKGIKGLKELLKQFETDGPGDEPIPGVDPKELFALAGRMLDAIKIEQKGSSVAVSASVDASEIAKMMARAAAEIEDAAARTGLEQNFRTIGEAIFNATQNNDGRFKQAVYAKDGKALLSWRVAILPYMEQKPLFDQIKKDEPWDSEHNKKFHDKMPKVFELTGAKAGSPSETFVQLLTGPNTAFPSPEGMQIPNTFKDGASNTLLFVEAEKSVNWMKPDDLKFDGTSPRAGFGAHFPRGTLAARADCSALWISPKAKPEKLRAAVTPDGQEPLDHDWYRK